MEHLGTDFNITGSVMSRAELEALRTKRGECVTCGRKCFRKKLFKMIPIDEPGVVENGRCLICKPLDRNGTAPTTRKATQADLERFNRSQMNLAGTSSRTLMSNSSAGSSGGPPLRMTRRSHSAIGTLDSGGPGSSRPGLSSRSQSYLPSSSSAMPPLPINASSNGNRFRPTTARSQSSDDIMANVYEESLLEENRRKYGSERSINTSRSHKSSSGYDQEYQEAIDRSIVESAASSLDGSHKGDGFDEYMIPADRGLLNRGGARDRQVGTQIIGGSARTLSSVSSMEDELPKMRSVFEEAGDAVSEGDDRIIPTGSAAEQEYLDSLQQGGESFADVVLVLKEAVSSENVVKKGLEDLAKCQFGPEDQEALSDMGAPQIVVDSISAHKDSYDVLLSGFGAVWNMSATTRNQVAFVRHGALDIIVSGMEKYIDKEEIQEKAVAILSNFGASKENLSALIDSGGVARIVEAMNKNSEVASIQVKGCSAATNLASHNSPLKSQIMQLGVGGAVVIAMVMHPEDFFLQEKAVRALRNLCANSDENKLELANIGGVDAVISAMQVHRDEAGVQLEGAWTLSNLAGNDSNKAVIGDCGGVDVVIRAMWVHSDNVGLQEWCCRALYTLTLDPQNGDIVLEVGGISAIVNAMQAHTDSAAVQEMGCAVLGNLAETKESKMRIVDEEALDAIVLAMVLHSDDMQIQERACMVLMRLAIVENYKPMQAANIGELVQAAGQKFPECQEASNRIIQAFESAGY